ncbi:pseudaminic acid cytidylyltransferase [Luteolibacter sp. SL250]|uniref:pseudaminic acid cytidylyltransferase n=1 Tax=Luteolibacter sp. SL250 TaxID=2995170 RepID=UPI00226E2997|nr:pseudaminic acid cytidylyltransferase [Luteolibacter sp. SL250]WAC20190.1 pseudaminic acid cytidylyltransferase [Luteolibacter sp. SL250]
MNIAIIPARGGSKRIPRKNIKAFLGRPMIGWSIDAALRAGIFDRIVVSTDDPGIRETALAAGAEVPFIRPPELSGDHTPTVPVIRHAIQWLEAEGTTVGKVCCIYATAPLLDPRFLVEGLAKLDQDPELEFALSLTSFGFPIQRALKLDAAGRTSMFQPEHELTRSQDLEHAYHDAGQFYWGTRNAWLENDRIFSARCQGVLLPLHLVQDIDTPEDWTRAEWMAKALLHERNP